MAHTQSRPQLNPCLGPAEQLQAKRQLLLAEKIIRCDKHGETRIDVLVGMSDMFISCPHCVKEKQQAEVLAKAQAERKQTALWSGISERYYGLGFDAYQTTTDKQQSLLSFARGYAQGFGKSTPNLIMTGATGTGKTMLAQLIASHLHDSGRKVLFIRSSEMLRQFKATWDLPTSAQYAAQNKLFKEWTSVDLLVVDEYGENDSAISKDMAKQDRERMSDVIDGRYSQSKPTLITTNLPKEQLIERLGSRAWDRLQQCIVVAGCNWQSYRQLNNRYLEI